MMRRPMIAVSLFVVMLLLVACGSGNESRRQDSLEPVIEEKTVQVNFSRQFDDIRIEIPKIVIQPTEIRVKISFKNTSNLIVSWFPAQGHIVADDTLFRRDIDFESGLPYGKFLPGEEFSGELKFISHPGQAINNLDKLKVIHFYLDDTLDQNDDSEDIYFDIQLDQPEKGIDAE